MYIYIYMYAPPYDLPFSDCTVGIVLGKRSLRRQRAARRRANSVSTISIIHIISIVSTCSIISMISIINCIVNSTSISSKFEALNFKMRVSSLRVTACLHIYIYIYNI